MKLKTKLMGGFLLMALLTGGLGAASLVNLRYVHGQLEETYTLDLRAIDKASTTLAQLHNLRVGAHRFIGAPSAQREEKIRNTILGDLEDFKRLQADFRQASLVKAGVLSLAPAEARTASFLGVVEQAMALKGRQGMVAAAWLLERDGRDRFLEAEEAMLALQTRARDQAKLRYDRAVTAANRAFGLTAGFLAFALLVGIGLALTLTRLIVRPVGQVAEAALGLGQGRLDQALTVRQDDEIGAMAESFRGMIGHLRDVVRRVRTATDTVAADASQIGASAEQVAHAARNQASAAEETSAAMAEMAVSVQQVAGNTQALAGSVEETAGAIVQMAASVQEVARSADRLGTAVEGATGAVRSLSESLSVATGDVEQAAVTSEQASETARQGRQAVDQTVAGMVRIDAVMGELVTRIDRLGKSSAEIGNIVQVIEDIAEQTNLLALNAAIEAARAGEHGRGFAVVADEVRKLADRSAKATGEIGNLIKGIQQEMTAAIHSTKTGYSAIQEGTTLANEAGAALHGIVEAVERVDGLMTTAARAMAEQVNEAGRIMTTMQDMSQMTRQVATATHEQARASEQIIKAVGTMRDMTSQVAAATAEQRKCGDQVAFAIQDIMRSAQETAEATEVVATSVSRLERQTHDLTEVMSFFQDDQAAPVPTELTLRVPPAPPASLPVPGRTPALR